MLSPCGAARAIALVGPALFGICFVGNARESLDSRVRAVRRFIAVCRGFQPNGYSGFQDIVNSSNLLQTIGRDGLLFLRFCLWFSVSTFHYTPFLYGWAPARSSRPFGGCAQRRGYGA
jgi:hypothetical protein